MFKPLFGVIVYKCFLQLFIIFINYIRKKHHIIKTTNLNHYKMAACQGASCDSGAGPSMGMGMGRGDSGNSSDTDSPPQSPWVGPLVRSENSAEIAQYHAAQALQAAIRARRNAANAAHAARAAVRAARLAQNAATQSFGRRPPGGGQRRKYTRRRK